MPARANARLFTTRLWPPRGMNTGWLGTAASSSARVGKRPSASWLSCQRLDATTHSPAGVIAARAASAREVDGQEVQPGAAHVVVRVVEARQDGQAGQVKLLRRGAGEGAHARRVADGQDAAVLDADGLDSGRTRAERVDAGVQQHG